MFTKILKERENETDHEIIEKKVKPTITVLASDDKSFSGTPRNMGSLSQTPRNMGSNRSISNAMGSDFSKSERITSPEKSPMGILNINLATKGLASFIGKHFEGVVKLDETSRSWKINEIRRTTEYHAMVANTIYKDMKSGNHSSYKMMGSERFYKTANNLSLRDAPSGNQKNQSIKEQRRDQEYKEFIAEELEKLKKKREELNAIEFQRAEKSRHSDSSSIQSSTSRKKVSIRNMGIIKSKNIKTSLSKKSNDPKQLMAKSMLAMIDKKDKDRKEAKSRHISKETEGVMGNTFKNIDSIQNMKNKIREMEDTEIIYDSIFSQIENQFKSKAVYKDKNKLNDLKKIIDNIRFNSTARPDGGTASPKVSEQIGHNAGIVHLDQKEIFDLIQETFHNIKDDQYDTLFDNKKGAKGHVDSLLKRLQGTTAFEDAKQDQKLEVKLEKISAESPSKRNNSDGSKNNGKLKII